MASFLLVSVFLVEPLGDAPVLTGVAGDEGLGEEKLGIEDTVGDDTDGEASEVCCGTLLLS